MPKRPQPVPRAFVATSGTVVGREHLRVGKNNQDGLAIGATDAALAVAVTDGCSEGRSSEVGARLAAEWLASWAPLEWTLSGESPQPFADALGRGLEGFIRRIASRFGVRPYEEIVADYFLFTFLVAVVGRRRAAIVGVGDGVFAVDGRVTVLDPGPENAPRYVAYGTLADHPRVPVTVHFVGLADAVEGMAVATDGAGELDSLPSLLVEPKYRRNLSLVHKHLQAAGHERRLFDDTTVATIVRRRAEVYSWSA